jgi:hypothetical protein
MFSNLFSGVVGVRFVSKKPTAADVDDLARRHQLLEGKWCIFPNRLISPS